MVKLWPRRGIGPGSNTTGMKNCRALVEGIIGWDPGTGWPIGE